MVLVRLFLCLAILLPVGGAGAAECAKTYGELDRSEKLKSLKVALPQPGLYGFVNQTRGSYFFIQASNAELTMTFFTTGLFELYAIKRTGPLEFCDDGTKLTVNGLDRVQTLFVEGAFLQFGEREPRQSFAPGEMPAALQKIHNFDIRMVSSEHK